MWRSGAVRATGSASAFEATSSGPAEHLSQTPCLVSPAEEGTALHRGQSPRWRLMYAMSSIAMKYLRHVRG